MEECDNDAKCAAIAQDKCSNNPTKGFNFCGIEGYGIRPTRRYSGKDHACVYEKPSCN